MILGGRIIRSVLTTGLWKCNVPVAKLTIGPNSVDVRVSEDLKVQRHHGGPAFVIGEDNPSYVRAGGGETLILRAQQLYLGSTQEAFDCAEPIEVDGGMRTFVPMYEGRSSLARLGLFSHISAGFGDYGFNAPFTLEFYYIGPYDNLVIPVGTRIGQIYRVALIPCFIY